MKRLIIIGTVVAAVGSIAWGVGSIVTGEATSRWIEARNAEGWVAFAGDISVSGFPTRFLTRLTDLDLADPDTGLALNTPVLELQQSVFRLDRIEARLPSDVLLGSPVEQLTITHAGISADLDVQPTNRFALDGMSATVTDVDLRSSEGWTLTLAAADVSVQRDGETSYQIAAIARDVRPPDSLRDLLDPAGLLPETIATADATLVTTFDATWNLASIEEARPQPTAIDIEDISAAWGDMLFRASGALEVTQGGVPEGSLAVRAENWRAMMDLAVNAGLVPESFERSAVTMLEVLAGLSGQPENIDATLSFSNGRIFLGPIPLGPAPNLRLR